MPMLKTITDGFTLRPGNLIITEFSKVGGVRYERVSFPSDSGDKPGIVKNVDNVSLFDISNRITSDSHYIMETQAQSTPIGWYTDDKGLANIRERLQLKIEEANELNAVAALAGSERRISIRIYPTRFPITPEITARLLEHTIEWLEYTRTGLLHGNTREVARGVDLILNMHLYTVDQYAAELRKAVPLARRLNSEMRKLLRGGEDPTTVHKKLELQEFTKIITYFQNAQELVK